MQNRYNVPDELETWLFRFNTFSSYYVVGIILEYEQGGNLKTKSIDLLDLKVE